MARSTVGFAEPPFTVLHQVAHLWAGEAMSGDRWILEGLASWAAGQVSTELELALPYDPAAVAADLAGNAFPLAEWTDPRSARRGRRVGVRGRVVADQPGGRAGRRDASGSALNCDGGRDGWLRAARRGPSRPAGRIAVITSRAYLDHLDAVTERAVVETLATPVLGEAAAAELAARTAARDRAPGACGRRR